MHEITLVYTLYAWYLAVIIWEQNSYLMLMHALSSAPSVYMYIMSEMLQQKASSFEFIIGEHLRKEDCRIICKEISFIRQIPNWVHLILKEIWCKPGKRILWLLIRKVTESRQWSVDVWNNYRKDLCISRTFLLKFWAKNRGCGLYTRPLLSDRVNWLVVVINWTENLR